MCEFVTKCENILKHESVGKNRSQKSLDIVSLRYGTLWLSFPSYTVVSIFA
jgi:hypothetical protein